MKSREGKIVVAGHTPALQFCCRGCSHAVLGRTMHELLEALYR